MAEVRLLEQWVLEGTTSLWHDDSGRERLLTHYDDDVGHPVTSTTATRSTAPAAASASGTTLRTDRGRGSSSALRGSAAASSRDLPATHATAINLLRRHAYIVSRANGAVRALCGELEGRVREADRLRAADPSVTPAQRLLLRSPRLQQEYAARLAIANDRLRLVLAAEEAHHPAWWQWLATAVIDADSYATDDEGCSGNPDAILTEAGGTAAGCVAGARKDFLAALEHRRETLARAGKSVHDAVATHCPTCRSRGSDTRDGGAPAVLCTCVFDTTLNTDLSSDAGGDGAHLGVGLRRTFCVDEGARAPRGAVSAATEAERARKDLDNVRAEVAAAAKANTDLLQILLAKAPWLIVVK